ncbi:Ig-like domain-containing protein [Corallococcus sp. M7]
MPRSSVIGSRSLLGLLVTATLLSCLSSSTPGSSAQAVAPSSPPEAQAPFDVSAVMRQVHFAYRPDGQAWRGGHSTYGVKAGTEGLTLTPFAPGVEGAPLGLGAMRSNRGGPGVGTARLERAGHLTLTRDGFVEHLRNTEDGVRQEWVFASAPGGAGDLVLTQSVKGLVYAGATASGLHFRDERTGLGFRYGHAAWVESSGRSTPLQARYVAGSLQFRVPAEVLAATAFPATVEPVVSPEFGMDQPVPGPQTSSQTRPAVASNGESSLVVWQDFRENTTKVYGARVSKDGEVLDPWGIGISRDSGSANAPRVASAGGGYLVVWQASTPAGTRVMTARVDRDGGLPDAAPSLIIDAHSFAPSVTSNGTVYFVAWSSSSGLRGTRVSSTGAIQDPAGLPLATSPREPNNAAVASNGTDFLVVWEDARYNGVGGIHGVRVSSAGTVLDPQGLVLASGSRTQWEPSVASNGTDYLVVWRDDSSPQGGDNLFGTRVTGTGTVLDAPAFAVSTANGDQSMPAVGSDGADYLVVWSDNRSGSDALFGARVTQTGTVLEGDGQFLARGSSFDTEPAVAFNGTDYLVAWGLDSDIHGMRVTRGGAVLDAGSVVLSTSASTQTAPAVASNGTDYLVVWSDSGHGGGSIVGVRVNALGEVLDPSGLVFAMGADRWFGTSTAVASNGTDYLVVWREGSDAALYGTRLTSAGEVLHPSGIRLSPSTLSYASEPRLASNGTDYLLVFNAWTDEFTVSFLAAARISGTGELLDDPVLRITDSARTSTPHAVASNGKDYFVAWTQSNGADLDIRGSRVTGAGAVLDPEGLVISADRYDQRSPAVASTGTDYLVVWAGFSGGNIPHIYGARVTETGTRLDPAGFVIATQRYQLDPAVTALETEYLVTWRDSEISSFDTNILGARVTESGILRELHGFPIAVTSDVEETPAVVYPGTGRTALVVYSREDNTAPYWSDRIRGRLVTFNDNRPPTAVGQSASTPEDTSLALTLQVRDPDGQPLTYELVTPPKRGNMSHWGANPTYVPAPDVAGSDSFTFRVSDGELRSAVVTVSLELTGVNDPPSVPALVAPAEDTVVTGGRVTFQWAASKDVDGDAIVYDLELLQAGTRLRQYRTAETTWALVADEALPVGSYSWRVTAVDPAGASSAASPERGFRVEDTAPTDAGTDDAGTADAGQPDAGPTGDEKPLPSDSGCGCNPAAGSTPSAPLLLAGLGVWLKWTRRRRQNRPEVAP